MTTVFASIETLEELLDFNFVDPTPEAIAEGLPKFALFSGGEVCFLKEEEKHSVPVTLPRGAVEILLPSWSRYRVFSLPPVEVVASYTFEYEGEEKFLWDQEATMSTYQKSIQSVSITIAK
jgi:hypothetical protein